MRGKILFSVVATLSLFFAFGTSYGEILGCYQKEHGQLRVVTDFAECLNSEESIIISPSDVTMVGEYQGELCLGMQEYSNALRFRIGLFHLGDIYYSLSGAQMSETGEAYALSGSAVEINGSLVMTVTSVRTFTDEDGPLLMSQMGQIKFDLATSTGSMGMIDVKQYKIFDDEHIGDEYSNLIKIDCP